jgi:hypothetical protein
MANKNENWGGGFDPPIHIEGPIVNSFCNGEFNLSDEDRRLFAISRGSIPSEKLPRFNSRRRAKKINIPLQSCP